MSRHIIDCFESTLTVIIGYDRPLNNFFGQVINGGHDVIHWVMGEESPELVAEQICEYATVAPELIETLKQEQRAGRNQPMTALVDHRTSSA